MKAWRTRLNSLWTRSVNRPARPMPPFSQHPGGKAKYLHLTDLDGDPTSVLKSVVVGVESSSYWVERIVELPKKEEPEAKAERRILTGFKVLAVLYRYIMVLAGEEVGSG